MNHLEWKIAETTLFNALEKLCDYSYTLSEESGHKILHKLRALTIASSIQTGLVDGKIVVNSPDSEKQTVMSFAKWFVKQVKELEKLMTVSYDKDEIARVKDALATKWGELTKPAIYTFEIISDEEEFLRAYATGPHSCMSGDDEETQNRLKFYTRNGVKLLKIMEDGVYHGRALLWTKEDGNYFMDRVYPGAYGTHMQAAFEHAKEQGWTYRCLNSDGLMKVVHGDKEVKTLSVPIKDPEGPTPFIDTLTGAYLDTDKKCYAHFGPLRKSLWSGQMSWGQRLPWISYDMFDTEGFCFDMVQTRDGFVLPSNMHRVVEFEDALVHPDSLIHCAVTGILGHVNDMSRVDVGRVRVFVHSSALVPAELCVDGATVLDRDKVLVTVGYCAGLYQSSRNVFNNQYGTWNVFEWDRIADIMRTHSRQINEVYQVVIFHTDEVGFERRYTRSQLSDYYRIDME